MPKLENKWWQNGSFLAFGASLGKGGKCFLVGGSRGEQGILCFCSIHWKTWEPQFSKLRLLLQPRIEILGES